MFIYVLSDSIDDQTIIEECLLSNSVIKYRLVSSAKILKHKMLINDRDKVCLLVFRIQSPDSDLIDIFHSTSLLDLILVDSDFEIPNDEVRVVQSDLQKVNEILDVLIFKYHFSAEHRNKPFLVRSGSKMKAIDKADITHIVSEGKYIVIHTEQKTFVVRQSLKAILKELPATFCRVHASYIVNIVLIDQMNMQENQLVLNDIQVPFSRKYKADLLNYYSLQ